MSIRECVQNSQAFAALQYAYDHRDAAAREHRRRGGKVVGMLGYDVPQELLIAADLFPVQITPVAGIRTPLAERYLELFFQTSSKLCFETLVNGCCSSYIDYLAVSNSSDQFVRLYLYLRELRRVEPELPIPELEFIDWLFSRSLLYAMRNERSLKLFWETAERWAGRSICEADYRRGVQICNENRAAVRELLSFRRGEHIRLTGEEALVIMGAGLFMDKPEHTRLVRALCADIPAWPEVPGTRIFFSGTDQADGWLYRTLEDSGAVVVGEDHNGGARLYERDVNPLYTPLRGLVDRYMLRTASIQKGGLSQRTAALNDAVHASGAQGVLLLSQKYEDAISWDYPEQKKLLDAAGIPSLKLRNLRYPFADNAGLKEQLRAFIETI